MSFIVDGHNLIPKISGLSLSSLDDEQELIALLQEYCRIRRKTVEIYFDHAPEGMSGTRAFGTVKVHFVRRGITADNAIIARIRQMGRSAVNWSVVTSDRRVQVESRALGAKIIPSEEFSLDMELAKNEARARSGVTKDSGISEADLDEWLRIFGDADNGKRKKRSP